VLKAKEEENDKTCGNNTGDLNQDNEDTEQLDYSLPPNTKAYQLFYEGKKPKEVAITLRPSEAKDFHSSFPLHWLF
jgi:hypothetical protein